MPPAGGSEPHSVNDYKVALVRLGVKLPTGSRSKAEYQELYEEAQQRQHGKRKQPMTPTDPATNRQTKQAKNAASQPARPVCPGQHSVLTSGEIAASCSA